MFGDMFGDMCDMIKGTKQGKLQSWEYNAKQREGTVSLAMVEMLRRPPPGFEDVVKRHFYLRRR